MPEICRFYGIIIRMYFLDHNPPHFHAQYGEAMAEYDINSLEIINGKLPHHAHALVTEWAAMHQNELIDNWQKAREHEKLSKIKPLD